MTIWPWYKPRIICHGNSSLDSQFPDMPVAITAELALLTYSRHRYTPIYIYKASPVHQAPASELQVLVQITSTSINHVLIIQDGFSWFCGQKWIGSYCMTPISVTVIPPCHINLQSPLHIRISFNRQFIKCVFRFLFSRIIRWTTSAFRWEAIDVACESSLGLIRR